MAPRSTVIEGLSSRSSSALSYCSARRSTWISSTRVEKYFSRTRENRTFFPRWRSAAAISRLNSSIEKSGSSGAADRSTSTVVSRQVVDVVDSQMVWGGGRGTRRSGVGLGRSRPLNVWPVAAAEK